jgi:quinol monooxygenase YgiN
MNIFHTKPLGQIDIKDVIVDNGSIGAGVAILDSELLSEARQNPTMEELMSKLAFLARFEAKPGKEEEVAKFLEFARDMARKEPTTINWYAFRLSHNTFGVFDTFNDEEGRQKHLNGPIGQALMAKTPELFTYPPSIEPVDVLGSKNPA